MHTAHRKAAPIALALVLAWPLANAQSTKPAKPVSPKATKSFGNEKAGGKLLTRDELRTCLKMQADMKSSNAALERDKAELQKERAALRQEGDALKADKDALERRRQEAATAFKAKADAHFARVQEFNRKASELADLEKTTQRDQRADRMRRDMEREQAEIKAADDALRQEMDGLNRANADEANAMNARATAYEQNARQWNERNDALTARLNDYRSVDDRWSANCADRRYDELDEIAIQQGR